MLMTRLLLARSCALALIVTALPPIGATEVAFNEAELAAAQTDPVIFPKPDTVGDPVTDPSFSAPGPDWIQIANESGFLPAPVDTESRRRHLVASPKNG